jgi:putative Holliday junction resolvase
MAVWIGIDPGGVRTGLAESDASGIMSFPWTTLPSAQVVDALLKRHQHEPLAGFVVGNPHRWDGSPTHGTPLADALAAKIQAAFPDLPVVRRSEQFTSKIASQAAFAAGASKRVKKDKGLLDAASAAVLLQDFLDEKKPRP